MTVKAKITCHCPSSEKTPVASCFVCGSTSAGEQHAGHKHHCFAGEPLHEVHSTNSCISLAEGQMLCRVENIEGCLNEHCYQRQPGEMQPVAKSYFFQQELKGLGFYACLI